MERKHGYIKNRNKGISITASFGDGEVFLDKMKAAIEAGECEIVTLALRRANEGGEENILDFIPKNITLMPNTSGARTAKEALRIAMLARESGCGDFIKIEVIHDSKYLLPDNYETIKVTEALAKEGFTVLPYVSPDLMWQGSWSVWVRLLLCFGSAHR